MVDHFSLRYEAVQGRLKSVENIMEQCEGKSLRDKIQVAKISCPAALYWISLNEHVFINDSSSYINARETEEIRNKNLSSIETLVFHYEKQVFFGSPGISDFLLTSMCFSLTLKNRKMF